MPRFAHSQHSFNGGELAPEVHGRRDIDKYAMGAKTIENFIVTPEGGLHRRPGTRYVGDISAAGTRSRLVNFTHEDGSSYILGFSDSEIRFYKGTEIVNQEARTIDNTAAATTPEEIELEDHGFTHLQGVITFSGSGLPTGITASTSYYPVLPETVTGAQASISTGADTITASSPASPNWNNHMGPYRFTTDGEMPGGLNAFTNYYLLGPSAGVTQLSTSAGGAAVVITSTGSGTWTLRPTADYMRDKFRLSTSATGSPVVDITAAGTGTSTLTPFSTINVSVVTSYTESELPDLAFAQSPDTLYIVHPNHRPAQLVKLSDTQWALDDVDFIDGPYLDENRDTSKTIGLSPTTISLAARVTMTLSDASIINDGQGWIAGSDIGRIVRVRGSSGTSDEPGYIEIDSVQSSTVAVGTVLQAAGGTLTSPYRWRLGAWSAATYRKETTYSGGNYPRAIAFAEQRLCFGGEHDTPQFISTSNTGALNVMRPTDLDDSATVLATNSVRVAVADKKTHPIQWLSTGGTLLAGSKSAVFSVRSSSDGGAFSPTDINAVKVSAVGASYVPPVSVDRQTVYVTRNSQGMQGIEGTERSSVIAPEPASDLSLLSRHIFGRTESIEEMSYQFDRRSVIWMVRSDGVLLGCTYVPEQEVFAWHTHTIGGSFSTGDAVVESVAVDSDTGGSFDRVWLIVKRTVNSSTVRYVEYFEDEWLDGVETSQRFVDCHPDAYSGSAATTFNLFGHLIGETLQVLGDGAVIADATVSEPIAGVGRVTTSKSHTDLIAGLGYTSIFKSLPIEVPDEEGTSMGKKARVDHVVFRLWDSHTGEVGIPAWDGDVANNRWSAIIQRGAGDVHGSPPAAFTGDVKVTVDGAFERSKGVHVRQTQPLSFNLLSMSVMGSSGQR